MVEFNLHLIQLLRFVLVVEDLFSGMNLDKFVKLIHIHSQKYNGDYVSWGLTKVHEGPINNSLNDDGFRLDFLSFIIFRIILHYKS